MSGGEPADLNLGGLGREWAGRHLTAFGPSLGPMIAGMPTPAVPGLELATRLELLVSFLAHAARESFVGGAEGAYAAQPVNMHAGSLMAAATTLEGLLQLEADPVRCAVAMITWTVQQRDLSCAGVLTGAQLEDLDAGTATPEQANGWMEGFPDVRYLMAFLANQQVFNLMARALADHEMDVGGVPEELARACRNVERGVHAVPPGTPRAQA